MKESRFGFILLVVSAFLIVLLGTSSTTLAASLQNITITTQNDLVIRQNQTDNTFSFQMYFFFDDYNNITSRTISISNSTHNISFNILSGTCANQNVPVWDIPGPYYGKHYVNCRFTITQNISRGIYNLTLNATDIFNNTYLPRVEIKITPAVTALRTAQINGSSAALIDFSSDTNSSLLIKHNRDLTSLVSVALYNQDPGIPAYDPFNTSQFVEFIGSKTWEFWYGNIIEWVEIRIHYTDAQIAALGLQESTLKLKSYNESTGSWQACAGSSVNMTGNYVYCNTTHFSTWTIVGEPVPTSSPASAPASSGSGGGGSGSSGAATPTSTPTAPAKETKTETVVAPAQILPLEIRTTAITSTNIPLTEAKGKQGLVLAITPQDLGIQEIDVEKINIVQTGNAQTTFTTSQDSLNAIAKISGLEENAKQALDEIKNQITTEQVLTLPVQANLQVFEVKSQETGKSTFVSKVSMTFTAEENLESVNILQVIPKSVAQNVAEVTFSGQQPKVIQADPVVQWSFESVTKGETKDLSYLVKKKVDSLDATTVAVAKQQVTEAEQVPMYGYITVIVAVIIIVIIVVAVVVIRRRK